MRTSTGNAALLGRQAWQQAERAHALAVEDRVAAHLSRRRGRLDHPVEDFLFTYYRLSPAALGRWHPGLDVLLAEAADSERTTWRWYRASPDGSVGVDEPALRRDRGGVARLIDRILTGTASRPPSFACFGLHEWAMVYQAHDRRHQSWPLRLGQAATDAVVEAHHLTCTHFDAFRFFTAPARPLNHVQPTRELAPQLEQPGCLHATMDLYKHAYSLGPAVPGDLLLACFDLARDVRALDMQASPYDLIELGYPAVPIETPAGKAEYARRQRYLSERAAPLRQELLVIATRLAQSPDPEA